MEGTPHIAQLYRRVFPTTSERLAAVGLSSPAFKDLALDLGYEGLLQRIRTDDEFVSQHDLEALRETLSLDYRATSWRSPWAPERPCSSAPSWPRSSRWPWSTPSATTPAEHRRQIDADLAAHFAAGTWHGFQRPQPPQE
ncbi:MAG: hypothetical protein H0V12_05725 [Chloroflexi bacterium]|nr:hypothetical protein [Chloroflexota bacterium]